MEPSSQLGFDLRALLEQLDQDKLSEFKSQLRALDLHQELEKISPRELEGAHGGLLAELLTRHCRPTWVEVVTVSALASINRLDLLERVKKEIQESPMKSFQKLRSPSAATAGAQDPHPAELEVIHESLEEAQPTLEEEPGLTSPRRPRLPLLLKARQVCPREPSAQEQEYRATARKLFRQLWERNWAASGSEEEREVTQRHKSQIPFYSPPVPGARHCAYTVVLQGPAGVGKSTLAKQLLLDWLEGSLAQPFSFTFYLCCKELRRLGPCSFEELLSRAWPGLPNALPEMRAQDQQLLFVLDGFEELRSPKGALISDICGDWRQPRPVPVLLGSLLIRKLAPRASMLVTTRPEGLSELQLVLERPHHVVVDGFLEQDRRAHFLQYFEDEKEALGALDLLESNACLARLGMAPAVCQLVASCLRLQLDRGEDPGPTCQTVTTLFLQFLCGQLGPPPRHQPDTALQAPLRAACLLAAVGTWAQSSVFDKQDLAELGLAERDLRPFLEKHVLLKDRDGEGCYSFLHLSIQHFLTALFYVLDGRPPATGDHPGSVPEMAQVFSRQARLEHAGLRQVGAFLFGLLNEDRAHELRVVFGVQVRMELRPVVLRCLVQPGEGELYALADLKEVLWCLHECGAESLARDTVEQVREMAVELSHRTDLTQLVFSLRHCRDLQKLSLQVGRNVFLDLNPEPEFQFQFGSAMSCFFRGQLHPVCTGFNDSRPWGDSTSLLALWNTLCSVFSTNKNLETLTITHSTLSSAVVKVLCKAIAAENCSLRGIVLEHLSPTDIYRDFCAALTGCRKLTHLSLQEEEENDALPWLSELLQHANCHLLCLRFSSSAPAPQWADFFSLLEINCPLMCLDLTDSKILDSCAKLLCRTLRHPKCRLQRLSLENCQLTEDCCQELASVLAVSQTLEHLCLARNPIGDRGLKVLRKGLCYPSCKLQTLVLWSCNVTSDSCCDLEAVLKQNTNLMHLDLGLNPIGLAGVKFLCSALRDPLCPLKSLWLWGCSIDHLSCQELSEALRTNKNLLCLDVGRNALKYSGLKLLCDVLRTHNRTLQRLKLYVDVYDPHVQELLTQTQASNTELIVEKDDTSLGRARPSTRLFTLPTPPLSFVQPLSCPLSPLGSPAREPHRRTDPPPSVSL